MNVKTSENRQYERSMKKEILKIGFPTFLESLFTTFASIIDSGMVHRNTVGGNIDRDPNSEK